MLKPKGRNREKQNIQTKEEHQNLSRLGQSFSLRGELSGNEDLVIDGRFQGQIDLGNHSLIVEKRGKVEAEIRAKDITIQGEMKGNVYASGKVFISKDAQMTGDISASRISIMDGAHFKGSVKMKESKGMLSS
ncbi:MAG: polymer-forming cytoskeletal protein [Candidatus Aminicenantes bacterium]